VLSLGLNSNEEGHLEPLPVAVDVLEADVAQPAKLGLHVGESVRGVLPVGRVAKRLVEAPVKARSRRGDVLEVGEDPSGLEQLEDFGVDRALTFVREVMDGEGGDDGAEAVEGGKRLGEVAADELH